MAAGAFHADKRCPQGMFRGEPFPRDETGTLDGPVPPGYLWSKRQEKLIQAFFREEIPHEPRSAFDKEDSAGEETADRGKNRPRSDSVPLPFFPDDDGGR